jgi:ATP-dependent DNA helicase RecG
MQSAYGKLRRILALELEQGCRDRAVIGGLARFLTFWERHAREESPSDATIDEALRALAGYASKPPEARRQALQSLLGALPSEPRAGEPGDLHNVVSSGATPVDETIRPTAGVREALGSSTSSERVAAVKPATASPEAPSGASSHDSLASPVSTLRGVSTAYQKRLARLGVQTILDLLYHFPRRYDDFGQLKTINRLSLGDEVTIVGVLRRLDTQTVRGRLITRATLSDATGAVGVVWFNQKYLAKALKVGQEIVISGTVDEYLGRLVFTAPEWEPLRREQLHTGRLVPIYPLTEGITSRWIRRLIRTTLSQWLAHLADPLPLAVLADARLVPLSEAVRQIHFPDNQTSLEAARRRLCFDELLLVELGVLSRRHSWRSEAGRALRIPHEVVQEFIQGLPFALTDAQRRAIDGILADMQQPFPMSRLLQGDVGSGKTVVAVVAMLVAARNGLQAALMVPTSVLAEQHHRTLSQLLAAMPEVHVELLVGSLSTQAKARARHALAEGSAQIAVGTHALIQEAVAFDRLGLVVVDEQHRFGVTQRSTLAAKAGDAHPHMLVMSATPIPRTLAMTLYGDLDVTVLDELPPNRQKIVTAVRDHRSREPIYAFTRSQVAEGRQAFIICPLVEESDRVDAKAAVAEHARLQDEVFPQLRLGLLHGRMSADEKEAVMAAFREGEYHILVSTAVVEVGIDVANATVILIEGAERFGLAQLHQFRGRVGRGEFKSYCILLSDDPSEQSLARLQIMEQSTDGFVLAEKDLEMRGPGDFFGVRQHGLPQLKVARLSDTAVLELARAQALRLFEADPALERPEHQALAEAVRRFWVAADLS